MAERCNVYRICTMVRKVLETVRIKACCQSKENQSFMTGQKRSLMKTNELDQLAEAIQNASVLESILEAIYTASLHPQALLETYRDAIYGSGQLACELKEILKQLLEQSDGQRIEEKKKSHPINSLCQQKTIATPMELCYNKEKEHDQ